MAESGSDN